jgi:uncharacterized membrane protein YedE/YeeE
MEFTVHQQVLGAVFGMAAILGAVANKTNFCTMGAVSDWVNMGDTGRLRAWLLAVAVAIAGVSALEASGAVTIGTSSFPPYRTPNFAWIRYLLGGLMFGVGMTLASGCGNKTMVRIGGGNLKSLVVLVIASIAAYLMLWTGFFETVFASWIGPTTANLANQGIKSQALGDVVSPLAGGAGAGRLNGALGFALAALIAIGVFSSREFRGNADNVLAGFVVGGLVVAGWYLTAGPLGREWKEFAEMSTQPPSRVEAQSFSFVSPMGDTVRYLLSPGDLSLLNFGVMALVGVIFGSGVYALASGRFRIEWFPDRRDFVNHAIGGVLMGIGGVLSMGCTIGQAITGISTLALGSFLAFAAIVAGAAATMKYQYWRMMREG